MTRPPPPAPRVLMYHSVSPSSGPDPHALRVHPDRLDRQLRYLRRRGLRGVSVAEWLAGVGRGDEGRLVALTFDDGYRDFVEYAMPLLARRGMTASVYVVAGRVAGFSDWDEPLLPLMTADDVRAAATAGHEVGSHSAGHVRLAGAAPDVLAREIADSRAVLAEVLGAVVPGFSFPYGSFDDAALRAVAEAGYDYACVTDDHTRPGDRHAIPRFYVGQKDTGLRLEAKFARHRLRARRHSAAS